MKFFSNITSLDELKAAYRHLVMLYHPDRGGDNETMKQLNYEYARFHKLLSNPPRNLNEVRVGHVITVNNSRCIVTEVGTEYFRARSLVTNREAYFSKSTGFAMLNFKLRATI